MRPQVLRNSILRAHLVMLSLCTLGESLKRHDRRCAPDPGTRHPPRAEVAHALPADGVSLFILVDHFESDSRFIIVVIYRLPRDKGNDFAQGRQAVLAHQTMRLEASALSNT